MCICVYRVPLTEAATSRRDTTQRTAKFETQQARAFPTSSRKKNVISVEVSRGNQGRVSLRHQEASLFFGVRRFPFPTEASWETVTFCIFLNWFLTLKHPP